MSRPAFSPEQFCEEYRLKVACGAAGDDDVSDALVAVGDRLHDSGDLESVLADMYGEGDTWAALDRLVCGRVNHFGDERVLQDLLARMKSLKADVERELDSQA